MQTLPHADLGLMQRLAQGVGFGSLQLGVPIKPKLGTEFAQEHTRDLCKGSLVITHGAARHTVPRHVG